jgi:hypothetical protein
VSEFCTEVPGNQVVAFNALTCLKEKDRAAISKEYSKNVIDFSFLKMRREDDCFRYFSEQTLLPPAMECYSEANFSQGAVVQNYCIEVTTQELVQIPDSEFDRARYIQQNAQMNANIWLNTLNSQVVGINTNARQFCNLIISYEDDVDWLVDNVIENRPGGVVTFLDEMGLLRDEAYRRSAQISTVTTGLNGFRELIAADGTQFAIIKRQANEKYNATTGVIADLERDMAELKEQIALFDAIIGAGVLGVLLGSLIIGIGALVPIPVVNKIIVGAGTLVVGGSSAAIGIATTNRNEARIEYRGIGLRIFSLQQTLALLQFIDDQLASLIDSNVRSVFATQAMATGFSILGNNINGIIENIDSVVGNAEGGAVLRRMLNVLVRNGKDLRELYLNAERQGILPVEPSTRVWNTLFPYRTTVPSKPKYPIPMDEYAVLLQKKVAWQHPLRRRCY